MPQLGLGLQPKIATGVGSLRNHDRLGSIGKRQGTRTLVADPNQILFFNGEEGYRVSHPVDGDDCTAFTFRWEILVEAVEL